MTCHSRVTGNGIIWESCEAESVTNTVLEQMIVDIFPVRYYKAENSDILLEGVQWGCWAPQALCDVTLLLQVFSTQLY